MSDKAEHELRIDFWQKRLDHTLAHTNSSNKHVYVVDGAVLGLVYFAVQTFGKDSVTNTLVPEVIHLAAIPTSLLAVLNLLHVFLVVNQGLWYRAIDRRLRDLLQERQIPKRWPWLRTHTIYAMIHFVITVFLGAAAWRMCSYR